MPVCYQPEFCAGWLYFQKSNYIIDTSVNNQMALHCVQHLVETDAIEASNNAETYKRAQRDGKLNSLSLQGIEGYYLEKLHLSFHSLY